MGITRETGVVLFVVLIAAWVMGQTLNPMFLVVISLLALGVIIVIPNRVVRPRLQVAILGWILLGIIVTIASCSGHLLSDAHNEQQARARDEGRKLQQAAARKREAQRNHDRRLAYNFAHPAEVARNRAEAHAKAVAQLKEQRRIQERERRMRTEDNRIASIPYATRLNHANVDFDKLLGRDDMFLNAVILHTYVKDEAEVVMVDEAAWHHLSEFERDTYRKTVESDWKSACVSNFACDKNDIHSDDGGRSLNYQFTSYFDSR